MVRDRGQGVIVGLAALLAIALPPSAARAQSETGTETPEKSVVEEMRRRLDLLQRRLEATEAERRADTERIRAARDRRPPPPRL
jgi:hypothetical protein